MRDSDKTKTQLIEELETLRTKLAGLEHTESEVGMTQQRIQAQKMALLSILVSGITHEINNPTSVVLLNAQILSGAWTEALPILDAYFDSHGDFALCGVPYSESRTSIGELTRGVSEAAKRIRQIVENLNGFARKEEGSLSARVDVNAVVKAAIVLASHLLKTSTDRLQVSCSREDLCVLGNSQQLEMVLINLLTSSCRSLRDRQEAIFVTTSRNDERGMAEVVVRDEGAGIAREELAGINTIVENHGGDLDIKSEAGTGTTVVVRLPLAPIVELEKKAKAIS